MTIFYTHHLYYTWNNFFVCCSNFFLIFLLIFFLVFVYLLPTFSHWFLPYCLFYILFMFLYPFISSDNSLYLFWACSCNLPYFFLNIFCCFFFTAFLMIKVSCLFMQSFFISFLISVSIIYVLYRDNKSFFMSYSNLLFSSKLALFILFILYVDIRKNEFYNCSL